jgi:predicted RNase H-like HicB family nuclease
MLIKQDCMRNLNENEFVVREDYLSYVAEVPEIPGCSASGSTPIEAIENLKKILLDLGLN